MLKRLLIHFLSVLLGLALVGSILLTIVVMLIYPNLPSLEALTDYNPKIPLRIYSVEGELLGEFGVERRTMVKIEAAPQILKDALVAAEDERFYQHHGTDYIALLRATLENLRGRKQGAGTITMQVAREFYLQREKTLTRKLYEILLAYKIETNLTKDQIFELYMNQINLGQRAYGFAAAAQIYFHKPLAEINVAEAAMLAGLPKAPSRFNPIANPKRAKERQLYVLKRMQELGFITAQEYDQAKDTPLKPKGGSYSSTHAEYVAEMARQVVFDAYGESAYEKGIKVYTSIRKEDQEAAYNALRQGVMDYDKRHGYRGPEAFFILPSEEQELEDTLEKSFADTPEIEGFTSAIILKNDREGLTVIRRNGEQLLLQGETLKYTQRAFADPALWKQKMRRGALIRLTLNADKWQITQLPQVESAFIALDPHDGAIRALVGGFDYTRNQFNHATLAQRQPGSSFKPFIYSAALEKGLTPATVIQDMPIHIDAAATGSEAWDPKNYDGKYEGPMRIRTALTKSKNMVSIRILQQIGVHYAQDYITRFGFTAEQHPAYLTMALGAGSATPLQMAGGYAIFANGGYRVTPYLITKIIDAEGNILQKNTAPQAGQDAEQVIDPRNAFIMTSMLQDVVRYGTATKALSLKRKDLAGKTGTTNEHVDAWFCGYNGDLVGVSWIGFDQPRSLGAGETGGHAALPIWINYMAKALQGRPETTWATPEGIATLPVGERSSNEYFYQEFTPALSSLALPKDTAVTAGSSNSPPED